MTAGTIHALVLAAVLIATAVACVRYRQKPSVPRVFLALLGAAVFAVGALGVSIHACGLGVPLSQWAVPTLSLAAALMFIGQPWVRRALATSVAIAGVVLSLHYAGEVHGPTFVGVPGPNPGYEIAGTKAEWHTWLTGLHRRVEDRAESHR